MALINECRFHLFYRWVSQQDENISRKLSLSFPWSLYQSIGHSGPIIALNKRISIVQLNFSSLLLMLFIPMCPNKSPIFLPYPEDEEDAVFDVYLV